MLVARLGVFLVAHLPPDLEPPLSNHRGLASPAFSPGSLAAVTASLEHLLGENINVKRALLICWWIHPVRASLFSSNNQNNKKKRKEGRKREKVQDSSNVLLFENFFLKAMRGEIENKYSLELSGSSLCAFFHLALIM